MKKFVYVTFRFNFILNILLENPNMNMRKVLFNSVIDRFLVNDEDIVDIKFIQITRMYFLLDIWNIIGNIWNIWKGASMI